MGIGWVAYRAGYAVRRRLGGLRRAAPGAEWPELPAPELHVKALDGGERLSLSRGDACVEEAERVLRGEYRIFTSRYVSAGFPPDWHANQLTEDESRTTDDGRRSEEDGGRRTEGGGRTVEGTISVGRRVPDLKHWSESSDETGGDIKGVWELNRFPWAFALARAYVRKGDRRFSEGFWCLFADWCEQNPPNCGPNWMCGQEATFRLMAAVFAAETVGIPDAHRDLFARFVVGTGRRIAANLGYALSQKNNHGVSECVGLVTCALLVPAHQESARWFDKGMKALQHQLMELVYDDGGFAQHSLIYHRVLLDDLCWLVSRLQAVNRQVPAWLWSSGKRATEFLLALVDPSTGLAPLYGANDGAQVLPIADAEFLDMRPTVQSAVATFCGGMPLPPGPWDEAIGWLVGRTDALPRKIWPRPADWWHSRSAGCFQLTRERDRLFLRCPTAFHHRPSQADMLHVDVWHDGRPVAMDGGSFSYDSREPFSALCAAAYHNVLTVDGVEPIEKFSRFLYLPWPHGTVERHEDGLAASHDGFERLGVRWMRTVTPRAPRGFAVADAVRGAAGHRVNWHWRLAGTAWQLGHATDGAVEAVERNTGYAVRWSGVPGIESRMVCADSDTADGWWSSRYAEVEPATSVRLECQATADVALTAQFIPAD